MDGALDAETMRNEFDLEFPVLYDSDHSVATEWGLFNLLGDGVSAPATFIIRTDGSLESALIGTNISERPTADSIIDVLASMAGMDRASMGDLADNDATGGQADAPGAPSIGERVPYFDLPTARGESISISDYAGEQNVVFVFFRAWW